LSPQPTFFDALTILLPFIAGVFGLLIGSFLNVCIVRLPKEESIVTPRSHCVNCGHQITWYENIPLVSFLYLRGKCSGCGARISSLYFWIELSTGFLFTALALFFGPTFEFLKFAVLGALMLTLTVTDLRDRILPDELTLAGLLFGVAFSFFTPIGDGMALWLTHFLGAWPAPMISALDSLLGAAAGAGSLWLVRAGYFAWRGKEGMGFGDIKLMAGIGAFLGLKETLLTIFLGSAAGSVIGMAYIVFRRRKGIGRLARRGGAWLMVIRLALITRLSLQGSRYELPFGSFLGAAAMVAALWGRGMVEWYISFL
jgi:leader peptidase (prepilin peptidase)/N-methyltransferase